MFFKSQIDDTVFFFGKFPGNGFKIVEYNVLSKRKYIYLNTSDYICDFYISKTDRIVSHRDKIDWNGKIIKLPLPINDNFYAGDFLKSADGIVNLYGVDGKHYSFNENGIINSHEIDFVNVSDDYKTVVWKRECEIYYEHVANVESKCLFQNGVRVMENAILCTYYVFKNGVDKMKFTTLGPYWVGGSNRLIYTMINKGAEIYNLETGKSCVIPREYPSFYDTTRNIFFYYDYDILEVYDVKTFCLISEIECKMIIVDYHKKWDVFITNKFELYRVAQSYKLELANIGKNYLSDRQYASSSLMDTIMEDYLLFDLLPVEILCTDMYREINCFSVLYPIGQRKMKHHDPS